MICGGCMAVAAGIVFFSWLFNLLGLGLIITAILLTIGERKYLCNLEA
jgi:hypothetical protein